MLLPHRWQLAGKMVERIKSIKQTLPETEEMEAALCTELSAELLRIHTCVMSLDEHTVRTLREDPQRIINYGQGDYHQFFAKANSHRRWAKAKYMGSLVRHFGCEMAIANLVADPKGLAK